MKTRNGTFFAILLIAILGGFAWLVLSQPREPVYQGKTLSAWLETLGTNRMQFFDLEPMANQPAAEAFEAMGANSVPFLRRELRAKDSPLMPLANKWFAKQSFVKIRFTPASVRQSRAVDAARAIGPPAKALIPDLLSLANSGPDPLNETRAMAALGPEAIGPLTSLFTNKNKRARSRAVNAFDFVRYDAEAAVPALLRCLDDPEPDVRFRAAHALAHIHKRLEVVVPALVNHLRDSDDKVRLWTAAWLGSLRSEARGAVPALLQVLGDPNFRDRATVTNLLRQIDPEAAAKAGVK